ncbi:hypothetical protein ABUW04_33535 [Streptacidiphilus sp. N1-10]|uniref:Uncharacterized protein n=1 Tax=Streptacidiphilus jeojiensis TaxID=3229225 RepID=A0ABV6XY22_9ACTN
MKIDPDDQRASMHRRWGLPVGIAAGVAALSVAAVAVTSGHGAAKPVTAVPALGAGSSTSAAPSPSATATSPSATATQGSVSGGTGSGPTAVHESSGSGASTVISATTTPIDAGTVSQILASCLGSDASRYHAVLAARTPIASTDWDGAVVAVDSAGQYVQCETKGSKGTSPDVPPTFINNRMWSPGHLIEFFDSFGMSAGRGKYLLLGAGHYASNIARITISYGTSPKEYPATMTGGVFFYSAALSVAVTPSSSRPVPGPSAYIHAYDASGKEIYKQQD